MIPVNKELFKRTYRIPMNNFEFVYCESQEQIILRFAEIVGNYKPDIDCRYNIFRYDQNFILKKVKMYDLEDEFTQRLLGNVIPIYYNIKETKVKVFEKNVEEKMAKYSFASLNINNRNIKFNLNKIIDCEYYYISGTINIDLLV